MVLVRPFRLGFPGQERPPLKPIWPVPTVGGLRGMGSVRTPWRDRSGLELISATLNQVNQAAAKGVSSGVRAREGGDSFVRLPG